MRHRRDLLLTLVGLDRWAGLFAQTLKGRTLHLACRGGSGRFRPLDAGGSARPTDLFHRKSYHKLLQRNNINLTLVV